MMRVTDDNAAIQSQATCDTIDSFSQHPKQSTSYYQNASPIEVEKCQCSCGVPVGDAIPGISLDLSFHRRRMTDSFSAKVVVQNGSTFGEVVFGLV